MALFDEDPFDRSDYEKDESTYDDAEARLESHWKTGRKRADKATNVENEHYNRYEGEEKTERSDLGLVGKIKEMIDNGDFDQEE
jgi:hypothetical protein